MAAVTDYSGGSKYPLTPALMIPVLRHLLPMIKSDGTVKKMTSVFVWGAMGVGKTDMVRQLAKKWGCDLLALHLPQFDPTDIKGIPVRDDDGNVRWVPSSELPQQGKIILKGTDGTVRLNSVHHRDLCAFLLDPEGVPVAWVNYLDREDKVPPGIRINIEAEEKMASVGSDNDLTGYSLIVAEKCLIFLDELSAADPSTQNAALQLVQDRKINEYDVPFGMPLVAAGNRESDGAYVQQLSAPLSNRFCHITVIPSSKDYVAWGFIHGVRADVLGFVQAKGTPVLCAFDPDKMADGECGFPTPRSWTNLSNDLDDDLPEELLRPIVAGHIGSSMATDFLAYRDLCSQLPDMNAVLDGKPVDLSGIKDLERSSIYMLVTALSYCMWDRYQALYDTDKKSKDQSQEWADTVSRFSNFLTDHIDHGELITYTVHVLTEILGIKLTSLRGEAFGNLASKHIAFYRKV